MSIRTKQITRAINLYSETSTNAEGNHGIEAFIALYQILGEDELHDGIYSAMQDEGFEEVYEDIIYYLEEVENTDRVNDELDDR